MRLYMIVSRDEYELPEIVSDSIAEIAKITKRNVISLRSAFCRGRKPEGKDYKYYKRYVTIDLEEGE